ncbi:phosphotransferase family enzyme [Nocardioides albertanoniae]|uniref:Phosphotransferase family enzyme n=1 Tax=Nocardioides albertanoniae TaxID=1175486 RepID=A0A543AAI3_9ACTN|nr:phosphotransferase [Nocardioides albertanoniae]TQL69612.1 phosphotransferase family enzyme [Nocardioides albertanoniae]
MSVREPVEVPGWDSHAEIVDEAFIDRAPRRPEVRDGLEWECRLLPLIAPLLPLAVPVPYEVPADADGPWRVRHRTVRGSAATPSALTRSDGLVVGDFLRSLHDVDLGALGLEPRVDSGLSATLTRMESEVVPLLPAAVREQGVGLIAEARCATPSSLAHGDLGPAHLLVDAGRISGVIDWTDSCLRDPAIDLAWVLNGTPETFRRGVREAYRPSDDDGRRALIWHRLGPWHEVLHGVDRGDPGFVESGLAGAVGRLTGSDDRSAS